MRAGDISKFSSTLKPTRAAFPRGNPPRKMILNEEATKHRVQGKACCHDHKQLTYQRQNALPPSGYNGGIIFPSGDVSGVCGR